MLAELHLAEDALALHLLLQCPKGLVDIVVTDENLHVVFLFNPTVDRPKSQGAPGQLARGQPLPKSNNHAFYPDPKVPFG